MTEREEPPNETSQNADCMDLIKSFRALLKSILPERAESPPAEQSALPASPTSAASDPQQPTHPTNRFRFSVEKSLGYMEAPTSMTAIRYRIVEAVKDLFPNSVIKAWVEPAAGDRSIASYHNKFFVIVDLADSSMSEVDFKEKLEDLKYVINTL